MLPVQSNERLARMRSAVTMTEALLRDYSKTEIRSHLSYNIIVT